MCILDFFNTKTLLQLLLEQKLISSKCVPFQNDLLQGDTVPLSLHDLRHIYGNTNTDINFKKTQ